MSEIPAASRASSPSLADEHSHGAVAHHFQDSQQQRSAAELGMWLFLVTEFMFFGGLFTAYLVYRYWHPQAFEAGGGTMNVTLGAINTAVLLTSSLTMALAVHFAQAANRKLLVGLLAATVLLGAAFLAVKAYEYHHKYEEGLVPFAGLDFHWEGPDVRGGQAFLNLYFLMTGLHALHMVIGIAILILLAVLAWRGGLLGERSTAVHNTGLYWHFVDLVWVYLFPFFYLISI